MRVKERLRWQRRDCNERMTRLRIAMTLRDPDDALSACAISSCGEANGVDLERFGGVADGGACGAGARTRTTSSARGILAASG